MGTSDDRAPFEWDPSLAAANVRDRYIAARFPGQLRRSADLANAAAVIDAARLYFDERKVERALELLDLAVKHSPADEPLQLARLEIAYLARDTELFSGYAREFHDRHPDSDAWPEVTRLGRAIAPGNGLFGARQGPRGYEHYGPWPHTPNWIQASWDLGSAVLGADFHRAMAQEAAVAGDTTGLEDAA